MNPSAGPATRGRGLSGLIIALCGGTALLVTLIFAVLFVAIIDQRQEAHGGRRASDLLRQASIAENSVVDLETGVRGYLLTGEPTFLSPYQQARAVLPAEVQGLRTLADGALELDQVNGIGGAINHYIDGYAVPLIAGAAHLGHAQQVRATLIGKRMIDGLRARFSTLTGGALTRLDQRRRAYDSRVTLAMVVAIVGGALSLALLIGLGLYILFRLLRPARTVAAAARRLAAGELDARVPEQGMGEVADLGRSFNSMAATLQEHDRELNETHAQLRRAVEEAEESSTTKTNFLANMSHEIRTPLNGMMGMMELLSKTPLDGEQREYLDLARTSSDALLLVLNDVLDIAKIEAGRLELERQTFDLCDLVEASCDLVSASAIGKGLELQSYIHDDVPMMVVGDRMRMGQILGNLLSNAVKFTPAGEVVLEASLAGREDGQVSIRFEVRDTGIGIARGRLSSLFERFTQAEAGTTRTYGGTGLGLTIARDLTEMMGGTIEVASELGQGSTFACAIPFAVPAADSTRSFSAQHDLRGLHVLIVDDNATNRRVFEAYLASWDMRPALASGADDAMTELRRAARKGDPYDIALLDFNMPEQNGLDLADKIRSAPELRHTRMILLSSSRPDPTQRDHGIAQTLTKPVRQSRLLGVIGEVMAGTEAPSAPSTVVGAEDGDVRPASASAVSGAGPAANGQSRAGATILVAEDHGVNWILVERMLAQRGIESINAADGQQALELLTRNRYDLVLMDCQMPLLDGYEVTRRIRQREASLGSAHTLIVAMTAHALPGERERCLVAGMADYLAKSITGDSLDDVLRRWLGSPGEASAGGAAGDASGATSPDGRSPGDQDGAGTPGADTGHEADTPGATLDPKRLEELRSLFVDLTMSEIVDKVEEDVLAQLRRLSEALTQGSGGEAREAAHRILGTAHMIGAHGLVAAATGLEGLALTDLGRARLAERDLRAQWARARSALQDEAATNTG